MTHHTQCRRFSTSFASRGAGSTIPANHSLEVPAAIYEVGVSILLAKGDRLNEKGVRISTHGYLFLVTLHLVIKVEIYGFKFPKRFFGDLFQRSHSFDSFDSFDSFLNLIIRPSPLHSQGSMPCKQQSNILTKGFIDGSLVCIAIWHWH